MFGAYVEDTTTSTPSAMCFVCYSWDSDDHKAWVRKLATALRSRGVDARFDEWDLKLGMDLTLYMESRIRSSDYVLLVCTPPFAERANTRKGGVGYENSIITGEIYSGTQSTKFIPVLRKGSPSAAMPSFLQNKLFVDLREDVHFEAGIKAIVRHVYQEPESELPPLGTPELLGAIGFASPVQQLITSSALDEYAHRNYSDLGLVRGHIDEIAGDLTSLGYKTISQFDMSIRPVRHIARQVQCPACRRYACDQIALALALANPDYAVMLGPHQAAHAEWLRQNRPRLRRDREGWL